MRDRTKLALWLIFSVLTSVNFLMALESDTGIFTIIEHGENYIDVEFTNPQFDSELINREGKEFTRLSNINAGISLQKGYPELLHYSAMFGVRNTGAYRVEEIKSVKEVIENIVIYPAQGVQNTEKTVKFEYQEDFYEKRQVKKYQPLPMLTLSSPAILRNYRTVNLTVNPMEYNVDKKELTVAKKIIFRITRFAENGANEITGERYKSRAFEKILRSLLLNYDYISENSRSEYQQRSIVIITPSNTILDPEVEAYASWKRNKGFHVEIGHTGQNGLDNSSSSIKNYLMGLYQNSTTPPEYVILVGDASGSISTTAYGYGDHYYSCLDGNDILPEAFVGRISVSTVSEFITYMSKMDQYERTLSLNQNQFNKSLLVGDTSPSGLSCVITCKYAKDLILERNPNHAFTEIYDGNPDNNLMNNAIDTGAMFFIYRGWAGMSNWDSSDINSLTNNNKLVNAVINTCSSGTFTTRTSNTEYLMRVGSPSSPRGAITAIGLATTHTHTQMNNCLTNGTMHGIYKEDLSTMGEAIMRGKLTLYNTYYNISSLATEDFCEWNNLMGDPSIDIWREPIKDMDYSIISNNGTVEASDSYIRLLVEDDNGDPLENAWVTIHDDNFQKSVYTGSDGIADIGLEMSLGDNLYTVVTKPDYKPVLRTIAVAGTETIKPSSIQVNDGVTETTSGNNDGIANPGEKINIDLTLRNYTDAAIFNPVAEIDSDDSCVYIVDSDDNFNTLYINGNVSGDNGFIVYISEDIQESRDILFNVTLTDENSVARTTEFRLPIVVPSLDVESIIIDDSVTNQYLQPGVQSSVAFTLNNSGSEIENVYGRLVSENHNVIVTDNEGFWGDIQSLSSLDNTPNEFTVQALQSAAYTNEIEFTLELFNYTGYTESKKITIPVSMNSGNNIATGPDNYGYLALDEDDVSYQYSPTYNWIEIDPSRPGSISGINTSLVDNGSHDPTNGTTQQIKHFDLPFTFKMYGVDYSRIGICSHGWVTFSNSGEHETEQVVFRNYPIPDACGPSPMIAAFWDDIYIGANAGVYYYADNTNHTYIVEWSNCKNRQGTAEETFQIILYDPDYYPTPTGDGNIKIQYKVFNNTDNYFTLDGEPKMGNYCTVGLESHDEVTGIEYTYNNEYDGNSGSITNNSAIMFTTVLKNTPEKFSHTSGYFILESTTGNNTLDAGEQLDLILNITNSGLENVDDLDIALTCDNGNVVLGSSSINDIVLKCNDITQKTVRLDTGIGLSTGDSFEIKIEYSNDGEAVYAEFLTFEIGQALSEYSILSGQVQFTNNNNLNCGDVRLKSGLYGLTGLENCNFSFYVKPGTYDLVGECVDYANSRNADITVTDGQEVTNISVIFDYIWRPENIAGVVDGTNAVLNWNSIGPDRTDFIHYKVYKWDNVSGFRLYDTVEDTTYSEEIPEGIEQRYYIKALYMAGESAMSEIISLTRHSTGNDEIEVPVYENNMAQNHPNPFNPETKISYSLKAGNQTTVKVYNIKGELVKTLVNEYKDSGSHSVMWHGKDNRGSNVGSGVYFIRIKSGSFNNTIKAVLLK